MYGAPIWGSTTKKNISIIQSAQTRVVRMLLGATCGNKKHTHRQTLFSEINWPNVGQILLAATTNLVRRASMNRSSNCLNKAIVKIDSQSNRNKKVMRLKHTGPIKRKSNIFSAHATESFNNLPQSLREPSFTNDQFKINYKMVL